MILDKQIEEKIRKKTESLLRKEGLDLVEFKIFLKGSTYVVRVITDYSEGGVSLNECARLNRLLFSYLDKDKILGEDFSVEVNSPGLDRKLKTRDDFLRVKGRNVSLWLNIPVKEKTYLEGKLLNVEEEKILLQGKELIEVFLNTIKCAKQKLD